MSEDGGVTPFEAVVDTASVTVIPWPSKGALGTWRFVEGGQPDTEPGPAWARVANEHGRQTIERVGCT